MNVLFETGQAGAVATTHDWLTPPEILQALGPFDLDPCASLYQPWRTATKQYTIEDDGLKKEWRGRVWCNPPYSRGNINKFIDKALYEAKENGVRSVFLVRFDPTAKWFQKAFKSGYCDIYMLDKRIKFKGADNTYPLSNCFIHFQAKDNKGGVYYI